MSNTARTEPAMEPRAGDRGPSGDKPAAEHGSPAGVEVDSPSMPDPLRAAEHRATQMAERMRAVAHAALGVIGAESTDALLPVLSDALRRVIPFDAFLLGLYDEEAGTLTFSGYDLGERTPAQTIAAAGTPSSRVIASRQSLIANRAGAPEAVGAVVLGTGRPSESTIRTPILGGSRALGILSVQSYTPDLYGSDDVEVVEAVASLAATALLNLELLADRRAAEEALQRANEELELRIEERTAELRERSEELETLSRTLREREEWFRSLIENAHDLVHVIDPEGITLYVSPSVERILGYRPDELVGRPALEIVHPEDLAEGTRTLAKVVSTPGTMVVGDFRLRHRDGGYRMVESFGRMIDADVAERRVIVVNARDITLRRQVEEALRDSEARYRSLIDNAHDIVTILDLEGGIVYQSPQLERVLGYAPAEMIGRNALDFVHPEDVAAPAEALQRILAEPGTTHTSEYRFRHADGGWRYLETFGRILVPDATEQGVVFNTRDVTERREAQQALQEREEHFRRLIETSHDLIMTTDREGRIAYVGPSLERLLGYTSEEFAALDRGDLFHPEDQPRVREAMMRALANPGEAVQSEHRVRHRDGSWRWFESIGRTLSPDSPDEGMVANARDVTERREAEAELQRQRAYFEQLLASVDAGIAAWDREGRFEYVSPNAMPDPELREWVIGKTLPEYCERMKVPAAIGRERVRYVQEVIETGRMTEIEERLERPGKEPLHLLRRNRPILDEAGEVVRVIGYSVDITERKRTEEAVRAATEAAEQAREVAERANLAKSEFLSRMSHELRTPMNSILGFGQLLERAQLLPEHRKGVTHILKAGRHLLQLINEVLEIARIEAGRHSLSLEPVKIGAVIREALALVRPLAGQYRVDLEDASSGDCGTFVQADRQRLTQVLLNVLANAIKYNRPGGRVEVSCELISDEAAAGDGGDLTGPDGTPRSRLVVRVRDNGRGIPTDRVDQLFTPFARLGAEQSDVEGTGLGLALSQRLTEAMGGTLSLEGTGVEGSTFRIELQVTSDPLEALDAAPAARASLDDVPHASATLLYIEDNLANLNLVETILLSRPNWRTLPALQGLVGVDLAREHAPDLILLDVHLPDVTGEEVLRRLRADARTASIPVVIITADATAGTAARLRAQGADAYLTKPLDIDEFLETLERFLPLAP